MGVVMMAKLYPIEQDILKKCDIVTFVKSSWSVLTLKCLALAPRYSVHSRRKCSTVIRQLQA